MIDRQILEDMMKTKTRIQIAYELGLTLHQVRKMIIDCGLSYSHAKFGYISTNLTNKQKQIVTACMLGDGTINKGGNFIMKMKLGSRLYMESLQHALVPIARPLTIFSKPKPEIVNGKIVDTDEKLWQCRFQTHRNKYFKQLRLKWYPNGVKTVPNGLKINDFILSHWFCQDGYNCQQIRAAMLFTLAFTVDEVNVLIDKIQRCGIECKINFNKAKPLIRIGSKNYFNFIRKISPYIVTNDMQYKIDTSMALLPCKMRLKKSTWPVS